MQLAAMQRSVPYHASTVLVLLLAIVFPHIGLIPLPFGYTVPVLLAIWWVLKKYGESFADLGLSVSNFKLGAVGQGLISAVLLFVVFQYVVAPVLSNWLGLPAANLQDFDFIKGNKAGLLFVVLMGWLVGGFYEELVFHGYLFTRIENWLGGSKAVLLSWLLSNLVFGAYHWQLGWSGAIQAGLAGLAYHGLVIRNQRNLWYAFFFHGFYDTIALTALYFEY